MKLKILSLTGLALSVLCSAYTKDVMPKISRLRDKVDKALENRETHSFKDLLENAQQSSDGKTLTIASPDVSGNLITKQLSPFELSLTLNKLTKKCNNLVWSNSSDLITTLQSLMSSEKKQYKEALDILNDMITEKYAEEKLPLCTFIKELEQEKQELQKSNTNIFRLMTRNAPEKNKLNELLQKTQALKTNIDKLINLVETILLRK